jgi:hypothetical protein
MGIKSINGEKTTETKSPYGDPSVRSFLLTATSFMGLSA